jgi:DNA-binding NarL/FixJ family response regulator
MARILVADGRGPGGRVPRVLATEHEITLTSKFDSAVELAEKSSFDLVMCNVQFDDSRMLELLQSIKKGKHKPHLPFLCYRDFKTALSLQLERGAELAARELGASGFIDASDNTTLNDADLLQIVREALPYSGPDGFVNACS